MTQLENSIKYYKSKKFGDKNAQNYEIVAKKQWDIIERNMYRNGIFLEYEVLNHLKKQNSDFEHQDTFLYPNEPGKNYIDYYFHNNPFFKMKDVEEISHKDFETDIIVRDEKCIDINNFKVYIRYNYLIECKSRSNPPVNYFIFPDFENEDFLRKLNSASKDRSQIRFKASEFAGDFWMTSKLWRTSINPVQVKLDTLEIDDKKTLEPAFWQLFRRIDYESNHNINEFLFNQFGFSNYAFPNSIKKPYYLQHVNKTISELKQDSMTHLKFIKGKIILNIAVFIPIVVVNGNIYSVNLNRLVSTPLEKKTKKIPAFVKKYSHLQMSGKGEHNKYTHLTRFVMEFLKSKEICFKDDSLFPTIFEPILDLIVISSSQFLIVFNYLKENLVNNFEKHLRGRLSSLNSDQLDSIDNLHYFSLILSNDNNLHKDLFENLFKQYKGINAK